jgi:hypothetical protein
MGHPHRDIPTWGIPTGTSSYGTSMRHQDIPRPHDYRSDTYSRQLLLVPYTFIENDHPPKAVAHKKEKCIVKLFYNAQTAFGAIYFYRK